MIGTVRKHIRTLLRKRWYLLLIVIAIGLLGYSGWYILADFLTTHRVNLPLPSVVVNKTTDSPGEAKIDIDKTDYRVSADMPRLLHMPSITTSGLIQQVGIDVQNNEIVAPTNIHIAGWFVHSVKPGDKGLSVIDGHVQGVYEQALFKQLDQLKPSDTFYVEYGDGSRRDFEVVSVKRYAANEAIEPLLKHDPSIESQLNLITCTGKFDKKTQRYDQRVIVVSKRI